MVRLRWTVQRPRTPQAWSVRAKVAIAATLSRVLRREVLVVTPRERHAPAPKWQRGLVHFATKTNFPFAIGLLLVCGGLTAVFYIQFAQDILYVIFNGERADLHDVANLPISFACL